jgi:hypothetical protein
MSTAESSKKPLAPIWVGLAIWLFFPLGLYLLWRHPTLGKNGKWWAAGITWACFLMFMGSRAENEGVPSPDNQTAEAPDADLPVVKKKSRKLPPISLPGNKRIQEAYQEGFEEGASLGFDWLDEVEAKASGRDVKAYLRENPLAKAEAQEQSMVLLKQMAAAADAAIRVHANLVERGISIGSDHPDADASEKQQGFAMGKSAGFNAVTVPLLLGK